MSQRGHSVNILQGSLCTNLLRFALPVMLSGLLQLAFNAADVIVVGRCAGDTALAAVTSTSALINLLINAFVGLSMGTNVVVAQALGRWDEDYVRRAVHTCVLLGTLLGVGIGVVGFFAAPVLLGLMGTPTSVIGEATLYLRIYFLGVPAMTVYNFGAAVLRGSGDTRRPMLFLIVSGALNLVLNLLFVLGLGMGVDGVAWATTIAQLLSCVLVLRCLMGEEDCRHLDLRRLQLDREVLGQVVRIGVPASLQSILLALSNVVIQSSVNSFGDVVMAGAGASSNIDSFVWTAMNSFYQACLTFTGGNLGAGDLRRVDKTMWHCMWMAGASGLILGGAAYVFGRPLLGVYTSSAQAVEHGMIRSLFVCVPYFLLGMADVVMGSMRGMGCSLSPMISSLLCTCALRLAWISTVFRAYHTEPVLYACYPVSWGVLLLANLMCWLLARRRVFRKVQEQILAAQ